MKSLSIKVDNNYDFAFEKDFKKILKRLQKVMSLPKKVCVDILITDNKTIKKISKNYRNIDKETDVLSFPFVFDSFSYELGFNFLGEIVLSYEKIAEQAEEFNHSLKREFCFLFTHGLVHLLGLDHKTPEDEEKFNNIVYEVINAEKIYR